MTKPRTTRSVLPPEPPQSDAEAGEAAVNWAVSKGVSDRVMQDVAAAAKRSQRRIRIAMGGIATLLVAGFVWHSANGKRDGAALNASAGGRPSTVVTHPAMQLLPDGSVVELKDGAKITVDFRPETRRVVLAQGEAHFKVAKDASRPFVVIAGKLEARAVGTAFAVQLEASRVEVLVTEGVVAVRPEDRRQRADGGGQTTNFKNSIPANPGTATGPHLSALSRQLSDVLVNAGSRVVVDLSATTGIPPPVQPLSPPQIAARLAWRVPTLDFSGAYLVDVASMFNQHNQRQIVLGEPGLRDLQISGVLRADNTSALLRILEIEFGIQAEFRGQNAVILTRAKKRPE